MDTRGGAALPGHMPSGMPSGGDTQVGARAAALNTTSSEVPDSPGKRSHASDASIASSVAADRPPVHPSSARGTRPSSGADGGVGGGTWGAPSGAAGDGEATARRPSSREERKWIEIELADRDSRDAPDASRRGLASSLPGSVADDAPSRDQEGSGSDAGWVPPTSTRTPGMASPGPEMFAFATAGSDPLGRSAAMSVASATGVDVSMFYDAGVADAAGRRIAAQLSDDEDEDSCSRAGEPGASGAGAPTPVVAVPDMYNSRSVMPHIIVKVHQRIVIPYRATR